MHEAEHGSRGAWAGPQAPPACLSPAPVPPPPALPLLSCRLSSSAWAWRFPSFKIRLRRQLEGAAVQQRTGLHPLASIMSWPTGDEPAVPGGQEAERLADRLPRPPPHHASCATAPRGVSGGSPPAPLCSGRMLRVDREARRRRAGPERAADSGTPHERAAGEHSRLWRARRSCPGAQLVPYSGRMLAVLCLCLSAARCSTPANEQWSRSHGMQAGRDHASGVDLFFARSAAHQHMQAGRGNAEETLSFMFTKSGAYRLLVKPQSPASFIPLAQLRASASSSSFVISVSSGYPSPRNSKACYIAPPTANDTEADFSSELPCEALNATLTVPFDKTEPVSAFLKNKIVADYEAMNISNVSVAELLVDRELDMCMSRKCLTLQVRRYDSWNNPVTSADMVSEISAEVQGVDSSMFEQVSRGISTVMSDGMLRKWETYQWIGRGGKSSIGNTTCRQFACNATKLLGPETNVIAWVVVRMDGVPLGKGSPFKVRVTGGGFHSFMVDPASMLGQIQAYSGAAIRLIPVDKAGNPVKGAFSHDGHCDPKSSCARMTDAIEKEGINIAAECYRNGALIKTRYELDVAASIRPFRPDTTCTQRGCGSPASQPSRTECMSCPFVNGEALIASVHSDAAISCLLNMTFNETRIQNPIRTQNTVGTEFFGTTLTEGQSVLSIVAGEPNAKFSTVRYPWANQTAKEFEGTISPKGAFELVVTLQDSYSNPSGGLVGVVAELRHPEMNVKLDAPKYNVTSGGFHVIGHVTVSGQYRLQLALEPFLVPLGGSPFLVDIAAGEPVIPHTLLIKHPETVTIDAFGQFFFQPRDLYLNFVTSRHEFFDSKNYAGASPNNKAPGFWVWVVPRNIKDRDTGQTLEPILDKSGFNILRCGDDPDPCLGNDPGLGAFVAAFRPEYVGKYYLELQYCDPRTHVSGVQCDAEPQAYNHTSMKPPQAPNPCGILPAGKGGARTGLACTLDAMGFTVRFFFLSFRFFALRTRHVTVC